LSVRIQGEKEALKERANSLKEKGKNGIKMAIVNIPSGTDASEANLEVHFFNANKIQNILTDTSSSEPIFSILGGRKIVGGRASGQIKVTQVSSSGIDDADNVLNLTVSPIGDYSSYTLTINYGDSIDPVFSDIQFKFRPGCFSIECIPEWEATKGSGYEPTIDYLAKDFDSFRHTLNVAMMERVPGWQPTSEADLDQVLIELLSAQGDELSDYQDRVAREAYVATARKRVSLARHARLVDYHIHQGNQASTWIAIKLDETGSVDHSVNLNSGLEWDKRLVVSTTANSVEPDSVVFMTKDEVQLHSLLNAAEVYTWSDSLTILYAGSTSVDLKFKDEAAADKVERIIREGKVTHLLIQEWLNPETGREGGRDPTKRQLLQLLKGDNGAEAGKDTVTNEWFVHVRWEEKDRLKSNYCIISQTHDKKKKIHGVSLFHGNLIQAYYGKPVVSVFEEEEEEGGGRDSGTSFFASPTIERTKKTDISKKKWSAICRLPEGPLLYEKTPPGGEIPPKSTIHLQVMSTDSIPQNLWPLANEVISLVHSGDTSEHFIVETDEMGMSLIRFGDGINGKTLPKNSQVVCSYQVGGGLDGNIGSDKLTHFDHESFPEIGSCWNPFDVIDGREPEPVEEIVRQAPEAYRFRQLRAITLQDYVDRVGTIGGVSKAAAQYMWTGSWRTVQIAIDPVGATELSDELREAIKLRLASVKLIGEDFEIRPARYIPLEIHVSFCIHEDYWSSDIRALVEQEFSDGYTYDGRMAFFHPDRWTFGQEIDASQIIGRLQTLEGVDYVIKVEMKRWNEPTPMASGTIKFRPNEILQVGNSPDHMEKGFIDFDIQGGRR